MATNGHVSHLAPFVGKVWRMRTQHTLRLLASGMKLNALGQRPQLLRDPELIISEWDNLQRIFASLALKTTSQSIIV